MTGIERVDYVRIPVTDMEQANHFYGDVLGLERDPNSPHDDWVEYAVGNVTLAVMTPHTHDYEFTPLPPGTIALRVPDVAEAREKLEAAGVQVGEMWDSGVCHGAGFRDPDGNAILLHRRYEPYAQNAWTWPDALDALTAAPDSHRLLFENDTVRVLETRIAPGETTQLHTHRWPGTLYVLSFGHFVRRDAEGTVLVDSRAGGVLPAPETALWSPSLPPHTLENVDATDIHLIGVELKS